MGGYAFVFRKYSIWYNKETDMKRLWVSGMLPTCAYSKDYQVRVIDGRNML